MDDKHLADMADQEQGKAAQQEKAIAKVEKKLKLMTEFDTSMAKEGRVAWDKYDNLVLKTAGRGRSFNPHPTSAELKTLFVIFEIPLPKPKPHAAACMEVLINYGITWDMYDGRRLVLKKEYKRLTGVQYNDGGLAEDDDCDHVSEGDINNDYERGGDESSSDDDSNKASDDSEDENDESSDVSISESSDEDDD